MEMEFNGDGDAVPGELLQLQDPGPVTWMQDQLQWSCFQGMQKLIRVQGSVERGQWTALEPLFLQFSALFPRK